MAEPDHFPRTPASSEFFMAIEIRSPASLTPDWFEQVLAAGGEKTRVKSFTAKRVGTGQIGDTYRFSLVC